MAANDRAESARQKRQKSSVLIIKTRGPSATSSQAFFLNRKLLRPESWALGQVLLDHHQRSTTQYPPGQTLNFKHYRIPYGVLCERANASHLTMTVGPFLNEIAEWCAAEGWPPLNALAVNAMTGSPGEGYDHAGRGSCNIQNWAAEFEQCVRFKKYPPHIPEQ